MIHKQLIKEIESFHYITSIQKLKSIDEFYKKLARTVRTLTTMKKLDSAQCLVQTLMDKLGPAQKIIAQQDDDCKDWNVDKLLANIKRYIEKNPLQNEIVIDNEIVIIEMNSTPSDIKTKEWKNF